MKPHVSKSEAAPKDSAESANSAEPSDSVIIELLAVEDEAASIVARAEKEAEEARLKADRDNSAAYNKAYTETASNIAQKRVDAKAAIKADYDKVLTEYRKDLLNLPLNHAAFNKLAGSIFGLGY
jgi:regulator of protease activity HflC (stomatin/prohibitin superfamily)